MLILANAAVLVTAFFLPFAVWAGCRICGYSLPPHRAASTRPVLEYGRGLSRSEFSGRRGQLISLLWNHKRPDAASPSCRLGLLQAEARAQDVMPIPDGVRKYALPLGTG